MATSRAPDTIVERINQDKKQLLAIFKTTPIVQLACERAKIGRATYYRWRKDDLIFAAAADEALLHGAGIVNDMAESQLMAAIRDRNMTAIIFWLKHHHPAYESRIRLSGVLHHVTDELTDDQAVLVKQALLNAGLIQGEDNE